MHQLTLARIVQTCTIHNIRNTNICHLRIPLLSAETCCFKYDYPAPDRSLIIINFDDASILIFNAPMHQYGLISSHHGYTASLWDMCNHDNCFLLPLDYFISQCRYVAQGTTYIHQCNCKSQVITATGYFKGTICIIVHLCCRCMCNCMEILFLTF